MLDPDVLRADRAAVHAGASGEVRGAAAVADTFSGRARFAQPALADFGAGVLVLAPPETRQHLAEIGWELVGVYASSI